MSSRRVLSTIHWAALAVALTPFVIKGLVEFSTDHDFVAYHLPRALGLYGLTTYTPNPFLVTMFKGIPPLPHVVQGLLALITGTPLAANWTNIIAVSLLILSLWWVGISSKAIRWTLTLWCGIPLFLRHIYSGMIDLWTASFSAMGILGVIILLTMPARKTHGLILALVGGTVIVWSRFQGWPYAALIFATIALCVIRDPSLRTRRIIAVLAAFAAVIPAWQIRNMIVLGNPTFPMRPPLLTKFVDIDPATYEVGDKLIENGGPETPEYLRPRPVWVRFLHSAFELNRFQPAPRPFTYSADQYDRHSPHHRVGGWFGLTTTLLLAALMGIAVFAPPARMAAGFVLLCWVTTALLPQSHELRYFLGLPLGSAILVGIYVDLLPRPLLAGIQLVAIGNALYIVALMWPLPITMQPLAEYASPEARAFWTLSADQRAASCYPLPHRKAIFYAGPHLNTYPVTRCE